MTHDEAPMISPLPEDEQPNTMPFDFYRVVEQAIGAGITIVSPTGRKLYVNSAFCTLVGYSAAELTGQVPPFSYWPEEDIPAIEAAFRTALGGNIPVEGFELRFRRADGTRFDALIQVRALDGPGQGWCATISDISRHKQLEQALRDEIDHRETVARKHQEVLVQHQAVQKRLIGLTNAINTLLGSFQQNTVVSELMVLAQELIKADAYAIWRADDARLSWNIVSAVGLSESYQQFIALSNQTPLRMPDTPIVIEDVRGISTFDSRRMHYQQEGIQALLILPLRLHGEFTGTLVFYYHKIQRFSELDLGLATALSHLTAATITTAEMYTAQHELKVRAEAMAQRAQFLAEASTLLNGSLDASTILCQVAELTVPLLADWSGVYTVDESNRVTPLIVTHQSPKKVGLAREMIERYPPNAATSKGLISTLRSGQSILVRDVSAEFLQQIAQDDTHLAMLKSVGIRSYMLVPLIARDRKLGVMSLAVGPSRPRYTGEDLRFAEDLAQRAAMAVVNAQLYAEAQQALAIRNQFLSIAAHELKTPMTALLGNAELLARRFAVNSSEDTPEQRLVQMIAQQTKRLNRLTISLLDLTRLQRGLFALDRAPVDLAAILTHVVEQVQPLLDKSQIHYSAPAEILIFGDSLRLEEVFYNLIQNAAKYSPQGGPIQLAIQQAGPEVVVRVADHGIGIPAAAMASLFEPFYRAAHSKGHKSSGMGLGLYIVKEIVTLHGGSVRAESTEGQGSTFEVRLPLLETAHHSATAASP